MNIIISAYACSPNHGSEPGMSWNWVKNLAKFHNIHLITNCEFKDELIQGVEDNCLKSKVFLYFNDIGKKAMEMGKNQGDWRFYYYYRNWQKETYCIAYQITQNNQIDLVHQLNMIGFREPGYLWKLNKPTIWGPIGGMSFTPLTFVTLSNFYLLIKYTLKNYISILQLKYSIRVKAAFKHNDVIIGANNDSKKSVKKYLNLDIPVVNETGCNLISDNPDNYELRFGKSSFDILWVGKDLFTKQLVLALKIIAELKDIDSIRFHVVGIKINSKNHIYYKNIIRQLQLEKVVAWHGIISHEEVKSMMLKHQLFLFTSIVEGTPHVILEAIESQLPIICFDSCGQGECVNNLVGLKIKLTNPSNAITEFSKGIRRLSINRNMLIEYSKNCITRSKELSWDLKIKEMNEYYDEALTNFESKKFS